MAISGFDPVGKDWEHDQAGAAKTIEKMCQVGMVAVIKISNDDVVLGDFTIIMPAGEKLNNIEQLELYSKQVGLYISRKKAEEALRVKSHKLEERDRLLAKLSAQVPGVIYQYRLFPDGSVYIPFASRGIWDVYEVSPEEVKKDGTKIHQRLHPDDYDGVMESINQSFKTLEIWKGEHRVILPSKGTRWLRGYARPEKLADNSVLWHGYITDVTERKQAEQEIMRQKAHFEALFVNTNSAIAYFDSNKKVFNINKEFTVLFGYKLEEVVDKVIYSILDPKETMGDYIVTAVLQGQIIEVETVCFDKGGKPIQVLIKGAPVYVDGKTVGGYAIFTDITKQKIAQSERAAYTKEIENQKLELEELYRQLDNEIDKAIKIHQNNLPEFLPKLKDISIEAYYQPSYIMGGDYYDVIKAKNKLIFYISDVSGHSLDGAMMSLFVKNSITSYVALADKEDIAPEKIMQYTFSRYCNENYPEDYFICLFIGILDLKTYNLSYVGSGYQFPFVLYNGAKRVELAGGGLPIACSYGMELMEIEEEQIRVDINSTLLLYTDGIVEEEINGEHYGTERLERVFADNQSLPPEIIKEKINQDYRNFTRNRNNKDDITYLILQRTKEKVKYYFEINSTVHDVSRIIDDINAKIVQQDETGIIRMGIYELLVNAVEHGNKFDPNKKAFISLEITDKYIFTKIRDMGEGFDWKTSLSKEYDPLSGYERGRGIAMTKIGMDYVGYNQKGNEVKFCKKL